MVEIEMFVDNLAWEQMTKCIIRDKGIGYVIAVIENCVYELGDEHWFENKYPAHIFKEKKEKRVFKTDNKIKDAVNSKIKITDIAKKYGLDTDKKGKTTCPFHEDNDPSLMLNDKKNVFYCFGCQAKGDIITFIRKMEEIKSGDQKGS